MMIPKLKEISIFTTPKELREIATKMEQRYITLKYMKEGCGWDLLL